MKPERIQKPLSGLETPTTFDRLASLEGWRPSAIRCGFQFPGFLDSVAFFNKVARLALEIGHHPKITVAESTVEIELSTPGVGLTELDFELADLIEAELAESA